MHYSDDEDVKLDFSDLAMDLSRSINSYQNICTQRILVDKSYTFNMCDLVRIVKYFGFGSLDMENVYQAVKDDDVDFDLEHYNYAESKKLLKKLRNSFQN